eukprot:TRINITY_DN10083_c0_g1_i12.p1 TRINITY_DN10083_c0_g1~~TRINITY_DN10083_c0_g1_i12.p1  ORF type:complete len:249 (+),score=58.69 TRINITY_DN10083_c0_g1_i12:613-1359(+)
MNKLIDKFIQNAYDSPVVGIEHLTEVKELPEEEEGDPFILTTRGTSNKKYTRNVGLASRSFTLKLPKKFLPEDDFGENIVESRRTYHELSKRRKMQLYPFQRTQHYSGGKFQGQEDAKAIMDCLKNANEGPVKYVIDDIEIEEIRGTRMGMYFSQSLVLPNKSDDPAVDSEDVCPHSNSIGFAEVDTVSKEFEEGKTSELNIVDSSNLDSLEPHSRHADKRKAGHRRNRPIVFDQAALRKAGSNVNLN